MRKLLCISVLSLLVFSTVVAAEKGNIKAIKGQKMVIKADPPQNFFNDGVSSSKPVNHNSRNGSVITLVDSSSNGFGMVSSVTRPLIVTEDENWFIAYRQYAGVGATQGQLGGAFSENGESWTVYPNLNANGNPPWGGGGVGTNLNPAQARYPSVIANGEYPYALWTEYTAITDFGSAYGGRPYYTYDQFEWDGGSFIYPRELDLTWETTFPDGLGKDLWLGSPSMTYDDETDSYVTAVSFSDWTRDNNYLFHSVAYEDGLVVFSTEQVLIDESLEAGCLVPGTADGSYNTAIHMDVNDSGVGVAGLIGLFAGCDPEAITGSPYTAGCYHQPIFKMTTDHGVSWFGSSDVCSNINGVYHIPDDVFLDVINNSFPDSYQNECDGDFADINDFWSYYDADFKVDANGNVHILMSMLPSGTSSLDATDYNYFIEGAGWYHFTIDSSYLDNPGPVNTDTGWNWSLVVEAKDTWIFTDNAANNLISNNQASLSFDRYNPDIVWVVTDLMTDHCGELFDDGGTPDDPCDDLYEYRDASQDIYVIKSIDGGSTWYNPVNATNTKDDPANYPVSWGGTCPDGLTTCGPEETYPHAAAWSTEDLVYYMFQMPNYGFNEIGTFEQADFMNLVYVGITEVTEDSADAYPEECVSGTLCNELGDATGDGISDILDIVTIVNHILGTSIITDEATFCGADITADSVVDILDIVTVVNNILGSGRLNDAFKANLIKTENSIELNSDGFISAIQMTIAHDPDSSIELKGNSMVSAHVTNDNETTLILVVPENGQILNIESVNGFSIVDVMVANSSGLITTNTVDQFALLSSYPNPFNPETTISFELFADSNVDLAIYNMVGQRVSTLMSGFYDNGYYDIVWNGTDLNGAELASGIYMVKLITDKNVSTNKITLLK